MKDKFKKLKVEKEEKGADKKMTERWDLTGLYESFSSDSFVRDREKMKELLAELEQWQPEEKPDPRDSAEDFVRLLQDYYETYSKLMAYSQLRLSVAARNEKALKIIEQLEKESARLTAPRVEFQKWLSGLEDREDIINSSELLQEHRFFLEELVEKSSYLLTREEETLAAQLKRTGSSAWTKLQQRLTSTLMIEVELEGEIKELPLSEVRNLAYKQDPEVRKAGYQAELEAYPEIEEPVAAALNGIKGEVLTLTERRGYQSPLAETLQDSRLEEETLEAMLAAMKDYLPEFRQYYRAKAGVLGYEGGLPYYGLFAPLGEVEMEFSYSQARDFIIENISRFSQEMADLYRRAFEEYWIDAETREGKRGGAFCYNINPIKESRILSNFTGSFSDMTTLAHELGHAYHGYCLRQESILNTSYPMPLAETASIFSETVITNAAIAEADSEQTFAILENKISQAGQVIVDIYSRFLFEDKLFAEREQAALSVEELKDFMLEAQREAYGEGLDHDNLHPYMWLNKPHYYSAGSNYYNFPYAFGLLFGLGVYALTRERGEEFLEEYNNLLTATGKNKAAEVAALVDIELNSREFWDNSLAVIGEDIDEFVRLAEGRTAN